MGRLGVVTHAKRQKRIPPNANENIVTTVCRRSAPIQSAAFHVYPASTHHRRLCCDHITTEVPEERICTFVTPSNVENRGTVRATHINERDNVFGDGWQRTELKVSERDEVSWTRLESHPTRDERIGFVLQLKQGLWHSLTAAVEIRKLWQSQNRTTEYHKMFITKPTQQPSNSMRLRCLCLRPRG